MLKMGYNYIIMLKDDIGLIQKYVTNICIFCCILLCIAVFSFPAAGQTDTGEFTYGEKDSCEFCLEDIMPLYQRALPLSTDDPMRFFLADDETLPYEYGYVFQDINDYYQYNWFTRIWEGTALPMDAGVLIGGNARSRLDTMDLDEDPNDFSRVLPYASLYVAPEKLGFGSGSIEYEFYSDAFGFNSPGKRLPRNISIKTGSDRITSYQLKDPAKDGGAVKDWMGVVYTGGIGKTVRDGKGGSTETVVAGSVEMPLFTIRYKDSVRDRNSDTYDLILRFTKVTFVSEADVEGALALMESGSIFLAPLLTESGRYTIELPASDRLSDEEADEGVRIGARIEFDYSIEDGNGVRPEGLIFFSMNDLDNPSMAPWLQTDADWGVNEQGNDYRWAEGFGIVRGAASFAVLPYYNHTIPDVYRTTVNSPNGDTSLIRVSRMKGSFADGTANGLYFSANTTIASGYAARNDGNTADTGVSLLIRPEGTMVMSASVGRRGSISMPFFVPGAGCKIEQSAAGGGRIWSEDASFRDGCRPAENTDLLKVVGSGSRSVHFFAPDEGYRVYRVKIDNEVIPFDRLQWDENGSAVYEITDDYGRESETVLYRFVRDENGVISVAFDNIQDAHAISVTFYRGGLWGLFEIMDTGAKSAVVIIAAYVVLVLAAVISWKRKKIHLTR